VSGLVVDVRVQEGDTVESGALLLVIEPPSSASA
jgi:biotin carboxyl carrier protein